MDFVAGYGMAAMFWIQLLYICNLGEHIQVSEIVDDYEFIYSMMWYSHFFPVVNLSNKIHELGEVMFPQDNGFADILYNIEWWVLPLDLQKDIMHLINRKQNVNGIKLGPFGTCINRDVFKIVCIYLRIKSTHSY